MKDETHAGKPLKTHLIAQKASSPTGTTVKDHWAYRFLKHHEDSLTCKDAGTFYRAWNRVDFQHHQERLMQERATQEKVRRMKVEAAQEKQRQIMIRKLLLQPKVNKNWKPG
jgi:hypothetical protein